MSTEMTLKDRSLNSDASQPALRPLGGAASLALFGVPAAVTCLAFYGLQPALTSLGFDALTSFYLALGAPLALLFFAALFTYRKIEGRPLTWPAFAERMRLPPLRWRDAAWGLGIFLVGGSLFGLLSNLALALIQRGWIPLPVYLPAIADPRLPFSADMLAHSAGGVIRGRWDIAVLYVIVFFFNIAGEELWWRGIIFPRQQLAFGRVTWLVHGLLWACFHVFKWWDILPLLAVCLPVGYCAQRTRSTWGPLIGHALVNGLSLVMVLLIIAR